MTNGPGTVLLRQRIGRSLWLSALFLLATAMTALADDFTYTVNPDGTITITGYSGPGDAVVIPSEIDDKTVTGIGVHAFDNCTNLSAFSVDSGNSVYSSVGGVLFNKSQSMLIQYPAAKTGSYTIPSTVTVIGYKAFQLCAGLTGVTIPNTVTRIGDYAFSSCTNLSGMTIPYSVTAIGTHAFEKCARLAAISVDSGNSVYYSSLDGILFNKNQTELIQYPAGKAGSYTVPTTVTTIGNSAFNNCTNLTGVTIPSTVVNIKDYAFASCTSLTNITIPSVVTNIGTLAFDNCARLAAITVNSGNPGYSSVGGVLFNNNQTELIGYPAGKAGSYTVPTTVTAISDRAFQRCTNLTGVTISYSVVSIGDYAFSFCAGLTGITIPSGVTFIGNQVFDNCAGLAAISVDSGNPNYSSVDGVLFDKSQAVLIQYPAGKAGNYTIPSTVTAIGYKAFQNCTNLASVAIPGTVATIGDYAFSFCTGLPGVTIPYSVTGIGNHVFDNCARLAAIAVDSGNPNYSSVDGVLFDKNQTVLIQYPAGKAGNYTVPNTVTAIVDKAFRYSTNLTSVSVPSGVISIGTLAFDGCASLSAISVNSGNPNYSSVDGVLFDKNQTVLIGYPAGKAGSYTVPNNVAAIGNSAFANSAGLAGVTIPSSVTSIGNSAFYNYTSMLSITIPGTVTSIGDWTFSSCSSLISATIGNGIGSIGDWAFSNCGGLAGMYFEGSAPGIASSAFEADSNLTVYYLPGASGWGQTFGGRPTAPWVNTFGPLIKANGAAGAAAIAYPGTLSITLAMNSGDYTGLPVDWWAVAQAGSSWYYMNNYFQWIPFDGNLSSCRPFHQGDLFNLPSTEVLNIFGLLPGSYTFWFAVDYPMDGILNIYGPILIASVIVTVQ